MPLRKERNRILRDLAAGKNRAFRQSMLGRTLSAVTLHETGTALTANYLKVALARERQPNRIVDVHIGALSQVGIRESAAAVCTMPNGL
jgi:hypothetical protein